MRIDVADGFVSMVAESPADGLSLGCLANMLGLAPEVTSRDVRLPLAKIPVSSLVWQNETPDAPGIWLARGRTGTIQTFVVPQEEIPESAQFQWSGPVVVTG